MPASRLSVLVLSPGNSCRSIIAEALLIHLSKGQIAAWSAGSKPKGHAHPKALAMLERHGVKCPEARSKSVEEFAGSHFDYVILVDDATPDQWPVFNETTQRLQWSVPDPAIQGNEAFEDCYKNLQDRLVSWIEGLNL